MRVSSTLLFTSATEGASIYYTTDGSEPDVSTAILYTAPFTVNTTAIIRAIAIKPDYGDSRVTTQSYLFLQDVLTQTGAGLPVDYRWDYEMDQDVVNDSRYSDMVNDLKSIPTISLALSAEGATGHCRAAAGVCSKIPAGLSRQAQIERSGGWPCRR